MSANNIAYSNWMTQSRNRENQVRMALHNQPNPFSARRAHNLAAGATQDQTEQLQQKEQRVQELEADLRRKKRIEQSRDATYRRAIEEIADNENMKS
ncbi:hypothetical protein J1614_007204 [Plenodomus biglobosus]|nr:hypothetical protein J1614_007204 [Plenodomus biglobosus]